MGRLDGKVIIVTGGAGGMGETHSHLFVEEGAKVVLTDVNEEKGQEIANDLGENALFIKHDVTDPEEWQEVVNQTEEKFGNITGLVNNAGISGSTDTPIEEVTKEDFYNMVDINQYGVFLGMQSVLNSMKKTDGASIVNISSVAGLFGGENLSPYVAAKFAVRGMTKAAALEFGEHNIRVNSIHPGTIETPMLRGGDPDLLDGLTEKTALNRLAKPEEISKLALYLLSDESAYSTGAEFVADGGLTASYN